MGNGDLLIVFSDVQRARCCLSCSCGSLVEEWLDCAAMRFEVWVVRTHGGAISTESALVGHPTLSGKAHDWLP